MALPPRARELGNVGCRITSIPRFMGHQRLGSTMIYARVHDRTVGQDYYRAMGKIERNLNLAVLETHAELITAMHAADV